MKPIKTQKFLQSFQKHLEKQKKHQNTIRSYLNDIVQFFKWVKTTMGDEFTFDEISKSDILDFRAFLITRKASSTSVNRRITALRQFFEFLVEIKIVNKNPVAKVSGISSESQAPVFLSRKDSLLLIRTAEKSLRSMETSILLLLLHCGLRSSEICGLTVGDLYLNPREGRLFIRGQRGKTMRFVYLSTRTQAALRLFCRRNNIRIMAKGKRHDYLYSQSGSQPLTQQAIDHVVKRIGKAAGLPFITPTMLRNTYAAQILMQGESEETVARMLGMSSVRTLVRSVESLKRASMEESVK